MFERVDGAVAHGVGLAQRIGRRVVREQALVVSGDQRDRLRPLVGDGQCLRRRVVAVTANFRLQLRLQLGAVAQVKAGPAAAERVRGTQPQPGFGLAMQPVGAPVGRHQGTVAPDRPELLATEALPDLTTCLDVGARV
jgi:hypothetical protein